MGDSVTQPKVPEDAEERTLFLFDKAREALNSARKIIQEKRFAVARRDVQYGIEFLGCVYQELTELAYGKSKKR